MLLSRFGAASCAGFVLALALGGCSSKADDDDTAPGGSGGVSGTPSGGASGSGGSLGGTGGTNAAGAGAGGASGGSAGTTAAGAGGTGADPCATALYCDDFEKYTTAPNGDWQVRSTSGSVTIDTAQHVSGTHAVKFSTQSASSATAMLRLQAAAVFPVQGNAFYGRMLYLLESAPTTSVHWTFIAGNGLVPGQTYHAIYRYGGQQPVTSGSVMMANYDTPDWYSDKSTPGSDCWHHGTRVVPVGKWTCVEWKFDGSSNSMQMWLDGVVANDLTIQGHGDGCVNAAADLPWTAPNFSSVDLGWESYQQDDPRNAWIDDVVISTTKIGCPSLPAAP